MRRLRLLFLMVLTLIATTRTAWTQTVLVAGHYPGGTWAELHDINDAGLAVGWGDVASGDTRMIAVSLADPSNPVWFESGVSSNGVWSDEGIGVSGNGLIAGNINTASGDARAYLWTVDGMPGIALGTLPGDDGSAAIAINKSGTLIVGTSYHWLNNKRDMWASPVVWTLVFTWQNGAPKKSWVIHALPTGGLEQHGAVFKNDVLNNWGGWGVNDRGQIVGDAWSDRFEEIALVWTPAACSEGWTIKQLPHQSRLPVAATYPFTEALSIDNDGYIAGDMSADGWNSNVPALWVMDFHKAPTWKLEVLENLSGMPGGTNTAWGINDLGAISGVSMDTAGNEFATRWINTNPGVATLIGFPGDYGRAMKENSTGIVVGRYRYGTGPLQAAAVALH